MGIKLVRSRHGGKSRNWYLRGTVRGIRVDESTGTPDKAAAEAIRIRREAELLNRSIFGERATKRFIEAALNYIEDNGEARYVGTYDKAADKWGGLIGHFGELQLSAIGQTELDAAAVTLYPNADPDTRNRQVFTPFIAIWNHAGMEPRNWRRPRLSKAQREAKARKGRVHATPEYVATLVDSCAAHERWHARALTLFLVYTGRRISECCRLEWDQVDLANRSAIIGETKNGEPIGVNLPDAAWEALANLPGDRRVGLVFGFKDRFAVRREFKSACDEAGLPYMNPHALGRHTFATWLRRYAGADLRLIMDAGGWQDSKSVQRYMHVMPDEASRATDRLPRVGGNAGTPEKKAGGSNV
jgi:hypothetical protein